MQRLAGDAGGWVLRGRTCALLLLAAVPGWAVAATPADTAKPAYKDAKAPVEQRIEDLLSRMEHDVAVYHGFLRAAIDARRKP